MSEEKEQSAAALRRELRRKKILENAEIRKQKIFGLAGAKTGLSENISELKTEERLEASTSKSDTNSCSNEIYESGLEHEAISAADDSRQHFPNVYTVTPDTISMSGTEKLTESASECDTEFMNEELGYADFEPSRSGSTSTLSQEDRHSERGDLLENGFDSACNSSRFPEYLNTSRLSNSGLSTSGSSFLSNAAERRLLDEPPYTVCVLDHPAAPCFLALTVSILITFNFGNLVSNSLIVPFFIWELQQFISSYGTLRHNIDNSNIVQSFLLLCGIKKEIVIQYVWITNLLRDITEDFSIYIVTVILWHFTVGFTEFIPSETQPS